jgi:hypothetical protein
LTKALFGKRYRARYNGTEQFDIYFHKNKFRQTLGALEERGYGLFWINRDRIGLVKYSPDHTGFVPKGETERVKWPEPVSRRGRT